MTDPLEHARALAVIPARGGSKGLPGKNLMPLGGVPLVARTIRAARSARRIDGVVVTSDDPAILALAEAEGAIPVVRPAALATDTAGSEAAILHALDAIGSGADRVVMLQCTSPFTEAGDIDALVAALDDPAIDAALTVVPDHGFLWTRGEAGGARGINHDETRPRARRQDLEPAFRESGAGYAMRTAPFRRSGHRFCGSVALIETKAPPIEIDDAADFAVARSFAAALPAASPGREMLGRIRALVTDFDGVHTDDAVIVSEEGIEHVRCSRRDGMGIELLRKAGVPVLILSKEVNPVVARRAAKLKLPVIHGCDDKLPVLARWADEQGVPLQDIAYVGNDVNDVPCMAAVGLSFAPADSHQSALDVAGYVLANTGGNGAVREVCDLLLAARS